MAESRGGLILGGGGISLGSILAVILSWGLNHSVLWAIVHFFCGWLYVFYYLIVHARC